MGIIRGRRIYKRRRTYPKKRFYRKYAARAGTVKGRPRTLRMLRSPRPQYRIVTLKYHDVASINPGAGTIGYYSFSANGLYDPNITGTGHQPMYFDQFSDMYDHYVVLRSYVSAIFYMQTVAASTMTTVGILLDDNNAVGSVSLDDLMEQENRRLKWKLLPASAAYSHNIRKVTMKYNPKGFFGIKDVADNRNLIGSVTSSNPTEQAYFNIWGVGTTGSTDPPTFEVMVHIYYTVMFSEPKETAGS